jgi:uncharacterized protein (DUF885 family)
MKYSAFFRSLLCKTPKELNDLDWSPKRSDDIRTKTFKRFHNQRRPFRDLERVVYGNTFNQGLGPVSPQQAARMLKIGRTKNIWPVRRIWNLFANARRFKRKFDQHLRDDAHVGLCYVPGGKTYYNHFIRQSTGRSIAAVRKLGKKEYAKIAAELKACTGESDLARAIEHCKIVKSFTSYEAVRKEALAILKKLEDVCRPEFKVMPKKYPSITVRKYIPGSSLAYYRIPSITCKFMYGRPSDRGQVVIQVEDLRRINLAELTLLMAHEVFPGHFYQMYCYRTPHFHFATWYNEGWGLYVEKFVDVFGPAYKVMRLSQRLLRAARCIIDTAIHERGVSFSKAKKMYSKLLPHLSKQMVESDILRYIAVPGQACSYLSGAVRFEKFARRARSLKDFHTGVLERGAGPIEYVF